MKSMIVKVPRLASLVRALNLVLRDTYPRGKVAGDSRRSTSVSVKRRIGNLDFKLLRAHKPGDGSLRVLEKLELCWPDLKGHPLISIIFHRKLSGTLVLRSSASSSSSFDMPTDSTSS